MSDIIGSDRGIESGAEPGAGPAGAAGPSDLAGTAGLTAPAGPVPQVRHAARGTAHEAVTEAYSFACMNCGYGWEQTYRIEHHTDTSGRPYVTYLADGAEVPSPLTRPTCGNCDGHHVRIMRSGQVADAVARRWTLEHRGRNTGGGHADHPARTERGVHRTRHWPSLHFLRRKPVRPTPTSPVQDPGPGTPVHGHGSAEEGAQHQPQSPAQAQHRIQSRTQPRPQPQHQSSQQPEDKKQGGRLDG